MTKSIRQELLAKNREGTYGVHEPVYAMANVYTSSEEGVTIQVNPDPLHLGLPYFKYYNSSRYFKATKIARILMDIPAYVYHSNNGRLEDWILNSNERKQLDSILSSRSTKYPGYTVWQAVIIDYSLEKFGIDFDIVKECTVRNQRNFIEEHLEKGDIDNPELVIPLDTKQIYYKNGIE